MKRMRYFIVPALTAFMLSACSGDEGMPAAGDDGEKVLIELNGMTVSGDDASLKAPVNTGDRFTASVAGWEAAEDAQNYAFAATWQSTAEVTASPDEPQTVTLSPLRYYNPDNDVKTYMKAWYPEGTLANGVVTFTAANTDASADVMLASEVGSKKDCTGKTLAFAHKTTQIKFLIKGDASLAGGTLLEGIVIKGAEVPRGIDLVSDNVVYNTADDLEVPGIDGTQTITADGVEAGEPVMIRPMTGNTLTLDVKTVSEGVEHTFPNVTATIDNDASFVEGKAYTITLTFKQEGVALTATVSEWTEGTGSSEII